MAFQAETLRIETFGDAESPERRREVRQAGLLMTRRCVARAIVALGTGWSRGRLGAASRLEEMKALVCHGDVEDVKERLEQGEIRLLARDTTI